MDKAFSTLPAEAGSRTEAALLDDLLARRHSCRAFLPRPVDDAVIATLLATAQRTASWCNSQPWEVVVTSGEATERLRRGFMARAATGRMDSDVAFPPDYIGVYKTRRRETAERLYRSVGVAMGDRVASGQQAAENFRFFGAPHVAIISAPKSLTGYGAIDCGGYVANFLLVATSLGVATIAQAALATQCAWLHEELGIGDDRDILCGVSFGYADAEHPANAFRTIRAPLHEAVRFVRD